MVVARQTAWLDELVLVREGELWAEEDPAVVNHPGAFSADLRAFPGLVRTSDQAASNPAEWARVAAAEAETELAGAGSGGRFMSGERASGLAGLRNRSKSSDDRETRG